MSFSLRQIRYFVATAETGSVSDAARDLSISQSSISKAVQDLELDLGFRLLDRTTQGMMLTEKGRQFHDHARRILAVVADARNAFTRGETSISGVIRIGCTPIVSAYILADALARYRRAHPLVTTSAIEERRDNLEELLIGGEIDVALMVVQSDSLTSFETKAVQVSKHQVWFPIGHALSRVARMTLDDLKGYPRVVLMADDAEGAPHCASRPGGPDYPIAFRTRSVETVRSLVASGAGIAVLPGFAFRHWSLEGNKIEARDIEEGLPETPVSLVWRRGSAVSQATREFISVASRSR